MMRVVERAVDSINGSDITVRAQEDHRFKISWVCGGTRVFATEDLQAAVELVNLLADFPDVWLLMRDTYDSSFTVRLVDGVLFADDTRSSLSEEGVQWRELRKAISKGLEDNAKRPEPDPDENLTGA